MSHQCIGIYILQKIKNMLNILIPSIPERKEILDILLNKLTSQIEYCDNIHPSLGKVSFIIDSSKKYLEGGLSIGKKREILLKKATAKYICFLDDDDDIAPNYVETLLFLCKENKDVCTFKSLFKCDAYWTTIDMSLFNNNEEATSDNEVKRNVWHICPIKREIALKAYEAFKDKEKTQIAAGKKGEVGQLIDTYVAGKIKAGDKRSPELIANEFIEERYLGAGKEEGALQKVIFSEDYKSTIKPAVDKLNRYQRQKQLTGKLSKEEQKMLDEAKFTVDQYIKKYPQFKQYITTETLATGGRVGLAEGTQPESVIEETVMKEGPSDVAIKPVNKLSYPELRDRLPKEITDDIVQLIANSEEALQDFSYIRTQRDINDFNVKYGVNLILPATR